MDTDKGLADRVFRLESSHTALLEKLEAHAVETRAANSRVHGRIDAVVEDVTDLKTSLTELKGLTQTVATSLSGNTNKIDSITSAVQPLVDVHNAFRAVRMFMLFIATPLSIVATVLGILTALGKM